MQGQSEPFFQSDATKKIKLGLLGARGYVGRELLRLLGNHSGIEVVCASSRALNGRGVQSFAASDHDWEHLENGACNAANSSTSFLSPDLLFSTLQLEDIANYSDVDVWVLALPNGMSEAWVAGFTNDKGNLNPSSGRSTPLLIDLSGDHRFNDDWVYGLTEAPNIRDRLRSASKISNPGCYATAAQVGLMPLILNKDDEEDSILDQTLIRMQRGAVPTIFGVSGYSGAGTTPSPKNDLKNVQNNLLPYALTGHLHEREISRHLSAAVSFSPHVGPFFQGIHLTISVPLQNINGITPEALLAQYQSYYESEPLVKISLDAPIVRENVGQHHVAVGGFTVDENNSRAVLVATIDNLLKGAATQALQNINVALGFDEFQGLDSV